MKAAIYARVSTQEQAEDKFSIDTQIADCERHCQRQGDTMVERYVDIQSGRDAVRDRAQFEQMLKDAKLGLYDKIVVWRPDRLFRGLKPAAKLAEVLDETGIGIEGVLQFLDRKMIGLWAWVAEQEIEGIKERTRSGKRANAREKGKWPGSSFIRYGYRYNSDRMSELYTGKLEIDEAEAKVVLDMFQKIADGWTIAKLCRWANEQGIPTKKHGKGWTKSFVSAMLRNTAYIGKGYYGKETRIGNRLVKTDNPVAMSYPKIIPEELFYKVQIKLSENKRKNDGSSRRTYMLMHLGRCGQCGGRLLCRTSHGLRYLCCARQLAFTHLHQCYQPKNQRMELIEDYIWNAVEDVLNDYQDSTHGLLIDRFDNAKQHRQQQIARADNEVERCKREKQRLLTAFRKGYATEAEIELQSRHIREEQEYWQEELAKLEVLETNTDAAWNSFWTHLQQIDRMFDWGFIIEPEQKKEILNLLLEEFIYFRDGKIELRFKLPVNENQVAETIATLSHDVVT